MQDKKVIVILGATGTGKTEMAINLAEEFNGEIINADSRSVYAGLDIGTAKPFISKKLKIKNKNQPISVQSVNHYLFDVADPRKDIYTVADFQKDAKKVIELIFKKGKVPFIVGGTGFYIDALIKGYKFPEGIDKNKLRRIRGELEESDKRDLLFRLKKVDPVSYKQIDRKNKRKVVRALEIFYLTGKKYSEGAKKSPLPYPVLKIGFKIRRKELYRRLDRRTELQFKQGLVREVSGLLKNGVPYSRFKEFGIEYWPVAQYLKNDLKISKGELIERIKYNTHKLVRRQETWFRRKQKIKWIKSEKEAKELIRIFLSTGKN